MHICTHVHTYKQESSSMQFPDSDAWRHQETQSDMPVVHAYACVCVCVRMYVCKHLFSVMEMSE